MTFEGIDPLANAKPGDEIVYDRHSYFFLRRAPTGEVMAPDVHQRMLEMPCPLTGLPKWPDTPQIVAAMAAQRLFLRSAPLPDPVRAQARAEEHCTADIWHRDKQGRLDRSDRGTELRDVVTRCWDALPDERRPMLGNASIERWVEEHPDMEAAVRTYGRVPAGSTLRNWIRTRGGPNDRRSADMPSRRGQGDRRRKVAPLVVAIGRLHAIAHACSERTTQVQYTRFKRDVARANEGGPVIVGDKSLEYVRPVVPLKAYGLTTFRLECRKAKSATTAEARLGPGARKQLFGGGGHAQEPTRALEIVQGDDTLLSKYFLIDAKNMVPVGLPNFACFFDVKCDAFLSWDLSLDRPSVSTWMRTLAGCAIPKAVPEHLQKDFPELRDLYGYITGTVLFDNALHYVGRAVEDASGDLAHGVRIAGEKEPTHKAKVERALATVLKYAKEFPTVSLPIAQMRRFGYDPRKHVVATVDQFRKWLDDAIQTYHTQPSSALGGRSPLQVWLEQIELHGHHQPKDVDQYLRTIGDVHEVLFDRTGCMVNELRYSAGTAGNEALLSDFAAKLGGPRGDDEPSYMAKVKSYDTCSVVSIFNPLTRRYVDLDCTMRRYGRDLPLWLHNKNIEFAKATAAEFRTEEQMEDAREGLTASFEAALPQATARQLRILGGVLDAPNVRRFIGRDVVLQQVPASANGMAEGLVLHDGRARTRKDPMGFLPRPARGGVNANRAERAAKAEQRDIAALAAAAARRAAAQTSAPEKADPRPAGAKRSKPKVAFEAAPHRPLGPGTFG